MIIYTLVLHLYISTTNVKNTVVSLIKFCAKMCNFKYSQHLTFYFVYFLDPVTRGIDIIGIVFYYTIYVALKYKLRFY